MKKYIVAFIIVVLLFPTVVVNGESEGRLVALGDSIPYGYKLSKDKKLPSKEAFPYIIGEEKGLDVTNLAVPGMTSKKLLEIVNNDRTVREAIMDADYIVIYIGGNDLLNVVKKHGGIDGIGMKDISPVMRDLIYNVSSTVLEIDRLTKAKIIVYNIYNPYPQSSIQLDTALHYINQQYASLVKLMSHFTTLQLADAYQAFEGHSDYIIKGDVHPTEAGQKALADQALNYIP